MASKASLNDVISLKKKKIVDSSPLHRACYIGNVGEVETLLKSGVDVNGGSFGRQMKSPLQVACKYGYLPIVQLLLDFGADVKWKPAEKRSAFNLAVKYGHTEIVVLLVSKEDVNAMEKDTFTSLSSASNRGLLEVVKLLCRHGANINKPDSDKETPLMSASRRGHLEVVKFLLENGAQVNMREEEEATALRLAAQNGHTEVVNILLENGADVNLPYSMLWTDLESASEAGHLEVVKALVGRGAIVTSVALYEASKKGHVSVAKVLLEHFSDINKGVYALNTPPIYIASANCHLEVVKLLVANGADVNQTNKEGIPPLYFPCEQGNYDIVKVLLRRGANPNVWLKESPVSVLDAALGEGKTKIVQLLLEYGADAHGPTGDNNTTYLHRIFEWEGNNATKESICEMLKILLQYGANVNAVQQLNAGRIRRITPLHIALRKKFATAVKILVAAGANVHVPMETVDTPETVEQLCKGDPELLSAIVQTWTPITHKGHPQFVRDAIYWRQKWNFGREVMNKIFSFVAFEWTKLKIKNKRKTKKKPAKGAKKTKATQ